MPIPVLLRPKLQRFQSTTARQLLQRQHLEGQQQRQQPQQRRLQRLQGVLKERQQSSLALVAVPAVVVAAVKVVALLVVPMEARTAQVRWPSSFPGFLAVQAVAAAAPVVLGPSHLLSQPPQPQAQA